MRPRVQNNTFDIIQRNNNYGLRASIESMEKVGDWAIVSLYVKTKSKHSYKEYDEWIDNFLSLRDPIIMFTTPDLFTTLLMKRTNGYPLILYNFYEFVNYNATKWKEQYQKDPEKDIHNPYLYFIWQSKVDLLYEATVLNPFNSLHFIYIDAGYYRTHEYRDTTQLSYRPTLEYFEKHGMMFLGIEKFTNEELLQAARMEWTFFGQTYAEDRLAGGIFYCRKNLCSEIQRMFHEARDVYATLDKFYGKEQNVLNTMCLMYHCPVYYPTSDNKWFGMQPLLAGKINLR